MTEACGRYFQSSGLTLSRPVPRCLFTWERSDSTLLSALGIAGVRLLLSCRSETVPGSALVPSLALADTALTSAKDVASFLYKNCVSRVTAGSTLNFSMHDTTNGTPGKDRTKIGLVAGQRGAAAAVLTPARQSIS